MRIKFTDKINKNDFWVEEYPSIKSISDEMKEGCYLAIIFDCEVCKNEIETLNEREATNKICKKCSREVKKNVK